MATLLHSESRRLYSWWWDSHISPKNSKWLQDNLTDMDAKVKAMIKLIEEDADSFARRAEMYYKKRPELMKLVEEFYRAYRALAERYDHATVELRQAHRTMAEAFPNQLSYAPGDDSPSGSFGPDGEPHTQEMPHPMCAFIDPDCLHRDSFGLSLRSSRGYPEESDSGINKKGLKQLDELFMSREAASQVSKVADRKMKKGLKVHEVAEGDTGRQAETEVQILKKALSEIQTEKEAALLQYQQSLQKLSSLERELKDVGGLDERASRAEIEIKILKETLAKLEAERDAGLLQYNKCLKRISALENVIYQTEEDSKGLNQRATKAEIESQQLKQELSALEAEKEAGLLQYNQCLQLLSSLQKKIFIAEENSRMLNELTERAETEAKAMEQALAKLKEEKDAAELQYELCMEKIAMMESEISHAQEDVNRLNSEIVTGAAKLKTVEEQCFLLRRSNHSLQSEAENLAQEIAKKDQELSEKENELEKLQVLLQDEQSRFIQVEANLQTLQKLHSHSQEEQKALAFELQNSLQILKDLEISNHDLQENLQQVKEENQNLKELNRNSVISITDLRNEIFSLKEIKEKLEEDVSLQVAQSNSLQQEICRLKQEIECSNTRYWALMEQVDLLGLSPECLGSSVKNLQDENLKLKEVCRKDSEEKEVLHEKLRAMDKLMEKNVALESSLSDLNRMLEGSREKVKELQESTQFLQGEKSSLAAEKSILLSQLQIMTENVQKLLEKSALLENSLSGANIELEGLRTRSRSLEELCRTIKYDKSNLQDERSSLVSQLKNVEERLGNLESRFTRLEDKYTGLEKEKDSTLCQVKGLWGLLGVEKQERSCYIQSSESRLEYLENQVHQLQEESRFSKKDFEEELDKSVNAQVEIFILQKFIKDLEEKNLSLLIECQKHVEASKLSNNLISELETENLEQQVEVEFLLDEIERLRMGVRQVLRALQFDPVNEHEDGSLAHILDNIEDLKSLALVNEDEKQQLVVENSVLLTLLEQLRLDCVELKSGKSMVEQEFKIMAGQHAMLETSSHELLEINRQLRLEVNKGEQQEKELKALLETRLVNLTSLQGSYLQLKEENLKALGENRSLLQKVLDLKEETRVLEEENSSILLEAVAVSNISSVFESFAAQKIKELAALSEDISSLNVINRDLKQKVELLGYKMQTKETESLRLNKKIEKLQQELQEEKDLTGQLNCQILIETDFLQEKATELFLAEQNIKAANNLNAEFCITIEELKRQCEESKIARDIIEKRVLELSQVCTDQKIEIECLHEAKDKMESEMATLHKEIEERRTREDNLSLELQGRSTDSEIWEAEASSFYFDLQISSIHEVLLQNKVHELTTFCGSLEVENATKDIEIEKMKEGFGILEGEIQRMKAHLSAYVPVINSLRENIEYLEHNALRTSQGKTGVETTSQLHEKRPEELINDESIAETDGISDLLKMKCRLKVVGEAVIKEMDRLAAEKAVVKKMDKLKLPEMGNTEKPLIKGAERLQLRCRSAAKKDVRKEEGELANEPADASKPQSNKPEVSEVRNGVLMKDIPLDEVSECSLYRRSKREHPRKDDQMHGLWESAERDCLNPMADKQNHEAPLLENTTARRQSENARRKSQDRSLELQIEKEVGIDKLEVSTSITTESNQEGKSLERLASDAQKLISLQTTVQDLKTKMESGKRSKRANDLEFERVKKQLQEVEEAIQQLVDADDQLTKDVEESPSNLEGNTSVKVEEQDSMRRKRVTEEARKRSEKIRRLQFEVQSIQYILLKLEDEKKSKSKRAFSGSRTGILLRDFIYRSGRRSSRRQRKGCFCGCARSSTTED